MHRIPTYRIVTCLVVLGATALSCSSSSSSGDDASGGASNPQGGSATGGSVSGGSATGGSVAGGAVTGGAVTGGSAPATGGASSGAGGRGSGGATGSTGGNTGPAGGSGTAGHPSGGNPSPATGGSVTTGGTNAGGQATGGREVFGGRSASGGTSADGGQSAAGGAATTGGQGGSGGGASSGCGKTGAATGVKSGETITVAGTERTYVLSVPTDYTGSTPLALVFAWHGANISGSLARMLFNLEAQSNGGAIFVYPDGLPMSGGMTGWDLATGSADFQFFEDLLGFITSNYCIDSNRIFSTGHSMGAMMTNTLGCQYGDILRAIAPASGTPPGGGRATCTGKVAAIIAHGNNDTTVAFSSGEASRDFWIAQNGCTTETATWAPEPACVEYQGCQTDLPVVWCVHDEAHAWPVLSGRDCTGDICFDFGAAVWAFFSSFK
jgi:poly(3-hydroxybutyrate) depolymerase